MSYSRKNKTFNVTYTKARYWHKKTHKEDVNGCIFCEVNVKEIVKVLEEKGFNVLGHGENWFKIKADTNYTDDLGGSTDETKELYRLITGRSEKEKALLLLMEKYKRSVEA
ncbi:hypothetical protein XO47_15180 [Listeria monocytogenes]|nr:hypothetical protein [Listeria monocytogenes]